MNCAQVKQHFHCFFDLKYCCTEVATCFETYVYRQEVGISYPCRITKGYLADVSFHSLQIPRPHRPQQDLLRRSVNLNKQAEIISSHYLQVSADLYMMISAFEVVQLINYRKQTALLCILARGDCDLRLFFFDMIQFY